MSGCPFSGGQLAELKAFVTFLEGNPAMIHQPMLSFFKDYLVGLGANLPPAPKEEQEAPAKKPPEPKAPEEPQDEEVQSEPESEVDLDMEGVIGNEAFKLFSFW